MNKLSYLILVLVAMLMSGCMMDGQNGRAIYTRQTGFKMTVIIDPVYYIPIPTFMVGESETIHLSTAKSKELLFEKSRENMEITEGKGDIKYKFHLKNKGEKPNLP